MAFVLPVITATQAPVAGAAWAAAGAAAGAGAAEARSEVLAPPAGPFVSVVGVTDAERLHDPGVGLGALLELLQRQLLVVVLVHRVEDLVHPL